MVGRLVGALEGGLVGTFDSGLVGVLDGALDSAMDGGLVSGAEQEGLRVSLGNLESGSEVPGSRDYPPQIIIC